MVNTIRTLIRKAIRRTKRTAVGDVIDTPVLFLHVPKCGGTSIKTALRDAYGLRSGIQVSLRGNISQGAFFELNSHDSKEAADQAGVPLHELREHVLLYHMSRSGQKFVTGHFHYSDAAYEEYHHKYTFVTLIRDPVERWYSHYYYNRDKEDEHFAVDEAIDEYLRSPRGRANGRLITRFFAGSDCSDKKFVESSIQNIEKFDVVGVLEDLGAFEDKLTDVLGANISIPVRKTSPTPAAQRRKEITPEIQRKVEEICEPDLAVYDYVRDKLTGAAES